MPAYDDEDDRSRRKSTFPISVIITLVFALASGTWYAATKVSGVDALVQDNQNLHQQLNTVQSVLVVGDKDRARETQEIQNRLLRIELQLNYLVTGKLGPSVSPGNTSSPQGSPP
jgi:hypothetical protein